jgi:purine-binding chemotaxis protein CheW
MENQQPLQADAGIPEENHQRLQLICLQVGKEYYALPIEQVKEIVPLSHITPVPLTRPFVLGVTNIRGNIIPVIQAELLFDTPPAERSDADQHKQFVIVIDGKNYLLGVLVHRLPETLNVKEKDVDRSPHIIQSEVGEQSYIKGIIRQPKRMIVLLDFYQLVESELMDQMVID